ncbi:hypothetical protein [Geodermatophilus sabuli]|uniref:hypothetical protein n=1 Tax=Geodermatophilus sabuli TaxID=1564158 RepID=UPI00155897A5|nr:hypothetical protein [Geodermatophilus sabuli]MBB3085648.1 hypothetical protein [Geodermatophilus sabuli]
MSWFGGAGAATPVLVLTGWAVAGLVLLAAGATARRRRPDEPAAASAVGAAA